MSDKNKAIVLLFTAVLALLFSGCGRGETGQSSEITDISVVSDISCESEASEGADFSDVSEESDVSDEVGDNVTYEYDDAGRPIREFYCDADGNMEYYREFSYSVKGLSQINSYAPDGKQLGIIDYIYDGNRLEKTCEFGADNKVTKIMFYNQEGNVDHYTEYTNDNGEATEVSRRADGTLLASFEFLYSESYYSFLLMSEYDENGVVTAKTVLKHDLGDRTVVMKYEFEDCREVRLTAMGGVFFDSIVYSYVKEYDGDQLSCLTWYDRDGAERLCREYGGGRAVKDVYKNADGSVDSYAVISEWNGENQPVSARLYAPDGTHIGSTGYVYGEDGRLTCENTYDSDGHKIKEITLAYEGYGRLSDCVENRFDKNGLQTYGLNRFYEAMMDTVSEFDDRGKLVKYSIYNFGGELMNYVLSDYYENGGLRKELGYSADGVLVGETDYNINGKRTENAYYRYGSYVGGHRFEYSAEGLLIREIVLDANEGIQSTVEYKHFETDGIESETEYNADGQKVRYIEYVKDSDGSWQETHWYKYKDGVLVSHTSSEEVDGRTIYSVYDSDGEVVSKYYYDESGYCGTPIIIS